MPDNDTTRCPVVDDVVVFARSSRESFAVLYQAYYDRVRHYCLKRLYRRCAAEDVCSDVFLYVARKMPTFRGTTEQDFRRWLFRIATTEVHAYLKHPRSAAKLCGTTPSNATPGASQRHDRSQFW